jgi:hypothetical protein
MRPINAHTSPARSTVAVIATVVAVAGCGSSRSSATTASDGSTHAAAATTASSQAQASGSPNFVIRQTTESGVTVKVEGRLGPPLPPSESDVDQATLRQCPYHLGNALVVRLDMVAAIESGQAGDVEVSDLGDEAKEEHELLVITPTSRCRHGGVNAATADFGHLTPQALGRATAWIVLPQVAAPAYPHPSSAELSKEGWVMLDPVVKVNGSEEQYNSSSEDADRMEGPSAVRCSPGEQIPRHIAVVTMPNVLSATNDQNYSKTCEEG